MLDFTLSIGIWRRINAVRCGGQFVWAKAAMAKVNP
jgi:hypothetical protein